MWKNFSSYLKFSFPYLQVTFLILHFDSYNLEKEVVLNVIDFRRNQGFFL